MTWKALKRFCDGPPEYGLNTPASEYVPVGLRMIRTTDITPGRLLTQVEHGVFVDPAIVGERHALEAGDLLLSRSGSLGQCLRVRDAMLPATFAGYLVRFRPLRGVEPRYLAYCAESVFFQQAVQADAVTSTISNFNAERYANLQLPDRKATEQRAIADFLDTETARIDALITKKRRLIELLVLRSRSVVSTGLGEVEAQEAHLGHVARVYSGAGFPHEHQGHETGDFPFFKVGDLARSEDGRWIDSAPNWVDRVTARALGCRIAPEGSVLFPKVGAALLGNQRRITRVSAAFDNNLMAVTSEILEPRYLRYFLSQVDLGEMANPGPVPSINEGVVGALPVPVPPRQEQTRLADELDAQLDRHDRLKTAIANQLDLLIEHRQALITTAVTGQIDPREAA